MKSSDMQISVHRNSDGVPTFIYPNEWDEDKIFLGICELCCRLSEELQAIPSYPEVDIDNLPQEFDFKSNINPSEIIYHAINQGDYYRVTFDGYMWNFDKNKIYKNLLNGKYVIV